MQANTDFQRLKAEQETYLSKCEQNLKQWEKFKQDYVTLKDRLKTLPDELKYNVMVPFGKLAFMPGKLVRTNEILVLLGDNWFIERSSKQSCEIIDRRLDGIEKHLEKLKKEMQIFNDQLTWTKDLIKETNEYVNIEEKFDEVADKSVSKKQLTDDEKQKQRIYLQNKAKQAQMRINERIESDKLMRQSGNQVEEVVEEEEEEEGDEEKDEEEDLQEEINVEKSTTQKKTVRWSDASEAVFEEEKIESHEDDNEEEHDENAYTDSEEDSVDEINDNDEQQHGQLNASNVIYIKHTEEHQDEQTRPKRTSISEPDDLNSCIQTPADIYKHFYKPKSILKSTSYVPLIAEEPLSEPSEDLQKEDFDAKKAFTGEIIEKNNTAPGSVEPTVDTTTKKISKFKASKQK